MPRFAVAFSLSSVGQYLGFAGSNPSTRRKIENGSMEIRKKLEAKKAEKSFEISAFLVFSRSDLNRPKDLAGAGGFEPATHGFGDRYSTN